MKNLDEHLIRSKIFDLVGEGRIATLSDIAFELTCLVSEEESDWGDDLVEVEDRSIEVLNKMCSEGLIYRVEGTSNFGTGGEIEYKLADPRDIVKARKNGT